MPYLAARATSFLKLASLSSAPLPNSGYFGSFANVRRTVCSHTALTPSQAPRAERQPPLQDVQILQAPNCARHMRLTCPETDLETTRESARLHQAGISPARQTPRKQTSQKLEQQMIHDKSYRRSSVPTLKYRITVKDATRPQ